MPEKQFIKPDFYPIALHHIASLILDSKKTVLKKKKFILKTTKAVC